MVLVYGPAGVGKTTLLSNLEKKILTECEKQASDDREIMPLVKIEAKCPDNGNFSWKGLYRSILRELGEPAIDQKIDPGKWESLEKECLTAAKSPNSSAEKLREVVENSLTKCRPKGVLIDEAQHMTVLASGKRLNDQQNTIKSIANETKTTHILFGSYDLLVLRNLNGQLARRSMDLHFRRYDHNSPEDVKAFRNVLYNFQKRLPLRNEPDLAAQWKFFYERSAGCIGVVKEHLNRALSQALDENCETLEMRHLEAVALSHSKALRLLNEAVDGEDKLKDEETNDEKELKDKLWLNCSQRSIKIVKKDGQVKTVPPARKSKDVGLRNPKRDVVGAGRSM